MKTLDYYTCKKKAISSLQLMEIAGKKLFNCLKEKVNIEQSNFEILIVAGLGNNGGDALVVSEHLINDNFNVKIVVIGDLNNLTPETRSVFNRINNNNTSIINITCESDIKLFYKLVNKANVIVDGIFGIGLDRDINGIFYECIRIINESKNFVFSIDIPSGIYGSSGNIAKIAVMANFTAIIQNYKIGNLLNDAKDYHGKLEVLDIGVLQDTNKSNKYLLTLLDVDKLLPKRKENTHKYNFEIRKNILILESASKVILDSESTDARASEELNKNIKQLKTYTEFVPWWVILIVSVSLGLGTMIGWKRIVVTIGEKIGKKHLSYAQGASAEIVAASTIAASTMLGLPVSTTHVLSSGIAGSMAYRGGIKNIQVDTVKSILLAWALTIPVAVIVSGGLFLLINWILH